MKQGSASDDHDEGSEHSGRVEPVEVVAHVENRLRTEKYRGEQEKAYEVETMKTRANLAAVQQGARDAGGQERDRNVRVEQIAPAEMFGPPAAHENPDHERHHAEDAPKPDAERPQLFGIFVQQHGLADRENDAAREAKQNARGHEKIDRFAHGANEREDGIKRIGRDESAVMRPIGPRSSAREESPARGRSYGPSSPRCRSSASRPADCRPRRARQSYSPAHWTTRRHCRARARC